jgi:hypothetical protein
MKINGYNIDYKLQDEWHVFTSVQLPGLYVANRQYDIAYNDIQMSIEKLLELNKENYAS